MGRRHHRQAQSIALGVMAGLVAAIHDLPRGSKNVDARDKPGHDESAAEFPQRKQSPFYCAWGCFHGFDL